MEMHLIQKHILRLLTKSKGMRYRDLKPPRVEGNQFSYHLKTLLSRGYIKRTHHTYTLTTKGIHHATQVNLDHFFVRIQPKVVTLIVCKNADGAYLMYTRGKQPFLGKVGFPYGKVHLGESVQDAAERELREKTGISARMNQKGIVYLLVKDAAGEVVTHMLAHVFVATYTRGEVSDAPFGSISWVYQKDVSRLPLMPGVTDILRIAESPSPHITFEELSFEEA